MRTKITAFVLLIVMLCGAMALTGCGVNTLKDFEDATVGILKNSSHEVRYLESFPEASFRYYDTNDALRAAAESGEVDCAIFDIPVRDDYRRYDQRLYSTEKLIGNIAFALSKSEGEGALISELDAFIKAQRENGTLAKLESKWRAKELPNDMALTAPASGANGKLTVAVDPTASPFVFKANGEYTGFEIELLYLFCTEKGYLVELVEASGADALAGVAGGSYDIAAGGISITESGKEIVAYSESYSQVEAVASYYVSGFRAVWDGGLLTRWTADSEWMVLVILAIAIISCVAIGYLLGSINSAIILSRILYRDDIRKHGSGNAGMTNMLRTYGMAAAGMTLLGDVLKTVLAVFLGSMLCGSGLGGYVAGAMCVCGHVFPIYYKFRGGKGVLCAATMIAMLSPWVFLICFGIFLIIVLMTRYVSLGSVIAAGTYPLFLVRLYSNGIGNAFAVIVALLIIICHRKNLGRLWRGEESKISFKRKGSANSDASKAVEATESEDGE